MQEEKQSRFSKSFLIPFSEIIEQQPQFYIKNFIPLPLGAITMLSAPGGSGKSFLLIQLAIRFLIENPNDKAFLWLSEDLPYFSKHRISLILEHILNITDETVIANIMNRLITTKEAPIHIISSDFKGLHINEEFALVKQYLEEYNFIALDPLIAFYGADENNNSHARYFMNQLNAWIADTNKSIVLVHHFSKKSKDSSGSTRGASAFVDAIRLLYELESLTLEEDKHLRNILIKKDNWGIRHLLSANGGNGDIYGIHVLPFKPQVVRWR